MMAFFMRSWKSGLASQRWLLAVCWLLLASWLPITVSAQHAELASLRVERTDEGLLLSARMEFALPTPVEDALNKGIPIHFVAEATVTRERWYWYDQQLADAHRYSRVVYLPLTRRWRVNSASTPLTDVSLGVSLTQHFDSLQEAMAAISRISRWRVASAADMDSSARQTLKFRFHLDASQLPRTLQLGTVGQSNWVVSVERQVDLTQETQR